MDWMQQYMTGSKGTPFGSMGGANNNPASYSGGAGKGGGNGGITPQSPNPYMPQGLNRFNSGYQVPRVANAYTNYQPRLMAGGLFSGIPQYNPNPQPIMGMSGSLLQDAGAAGSGPGDGAGVNAGVGGTGAAGGNNGIGVSGVSGGGQAPGEAPGPGADAGGSGGGGGSK